METESENPTNEIWTEAQQPIGDGFEGSACTLSGYLAACDQLLNLDMYEVRNGEISDMPIEF